MKNPANFIGSKKANAKFYGRALCNHWDIEINLHWQLDVAMGEDQNRLSQRNGAENLAAIRRLALTLLNSIFRNEAWLASKFRQWQTPLFSKKSSPVISNKGSFDA